MLLARKIQHGGALPITDPNHPDLIAMYTMDNISGSTLVDESPNGNDATITGATAVTGHIGNALDYNGTSDLARSSAYPSTTLTELSFGGWVNYDTLSGLNHFFTHQVRTAGNGSANNSGCYMSVGDFLSSGSMRLFGLHVVQNNENVTDSNSNNRTDFQIIAYGATTITTGSYFFVWYELTNGGKTSSIYLNNSLESTVTSTQAIQYSSEGATSGENLAHYTPHTGPPFNFMDGKQDQFRMFRRALTTAERTALYNGGTGA